jgi:hypothetical protein
MLMLLSGSGSSAGKPPGKNSKKLVKATRETGTFDAELGVHGINRPKYLWANESDEQKRGKSWLTLFVT